MKKNVVNFFALLLITQIFFSSCSPECRCHLNLGCAILTSTHNVTGNVTEKKTFCSNLDYYNDYILEDSVTKFRSRNNYGGATTITRADSVYYRTETGNLKSNQTQMYQDKGYYCNCYK